MNAVLNVGIHCEQEIRMEKRGGEEVMRGTIEGNDVEGGERRKIYRERKMGIWGIDWYEDDEFVV